MTIPNQVEHGAHHAGDRTHIECIDPATRERLGLVRVDTAGDVEAAVARAQAAQKQWRKTSFEERREVLRKLMAYTVEHKDEICLTIQRDSGKTRENALLGEIWTTCEKFRWIIKNGERHLRPERVSSGLLVHKKARLEFHPLGVVAAIIPWNYPFQNMVNPIIPALMTGNAIVIKPSEWVAWSSQRFVDAFRGVIADSGHDPDLIQVVQGYGATGASLVRSPVDMILFIGSVKNGRRVIEGSAERVTPVVMELGGKDAFIVCDDADLEQALHAALAGCYVNCRTELCRLGAYSRSRQHLRRVRASSRYAGDRASARQRQGSSSRRRSHHHSTPARRHRRRGARGNCARRSSGGWRKADADRPG